MAVWLFVFLIFQSPDRKTITFPSGDGVTITADVYAPHELTAPMILLFHQASWSRGEYHEIAPKLNALGFNCMAVDLRSGGTINGVVNQTNESAKALLKETRYVDALPDMQNAISHARKNYAKGQLILWGSSYSAGLVLKVAGDNRGIADGIVAFSPGEYFTSQGKPRDYITSSALMIDDPVFITSAQNEKSNWWGMYVSISSAEKQYFLPKTTGNHGSRALWARFDDSPDYWNSVKSFLETFR